MLTSFFGKSRPLNFLILIGYVLVISGVYYVLNIDSGVGSKAILTVLGVVGMLIFSLLLLDFIIRKNRLTGLNTYAILIFSSSAMMLPDLINELDMVIANVFLLLSLRRIFSLRSFKNVERKILDATIWIVVSSAFYFWCLLLIIPLYVAITNIPQRSIRYYLIPVTGWTGLLLMVMAYQLLVDDSFTWFQQWLDGISFDFSSYAQMNTLVLITFVSATIIWTTLSYFVTLSSVVKKDRPNRILVLYVLGVSIFMALMTSGKSGGELIFILTPAAIVISAYIEKRSEIWFREILLWVFVLLPILFVYL
jgi:Family of unknown function (DUF6427)